MSAASREITDRAWCWYVFLTFQLLIRILYCADALAAEGKLLCL